MVFLYGVGGHTSSLNTQKALISLHFRNPEPHNKVLAQQHPNMG
jgi:hypothetical protein